MTTVVNVKVGSIRPKYINLKEWMDDPQNVYIGRAGIVFIEKERFPKKSSDFCNPFKIGKDGTREDVILKYETYIRDKLKKDEDLVRDLKEMNGKRLGCWCKPEGCHGDVLVKLINEYCCYRRKVKILRPNK